MQLNILSSVINIFLMIVEVSLSLRFLLKFFGANVSAPFTQWIYNNTEPLLTPFLNIFPAPRIDGTFTIEFTSLFAIIIYMILGHMLIEALEFVSSTTSRHTSRKN